MKFSLFLNKLLKNPDSLVLTINGDLGKIPSIEDGQIGKNNIVEFNGQKYRLGNGNDYQLVLEKIYGGLLDMEEERRFSDYVNIDDPNNCLSMGLINYDNKRADINAFTMDVDTIQIE